MTDSKKNNLGFFSLSPCFNYVISVGDISQWDVEAEEMDTFMSILLRAKTMNLLRHDVNIF